MANALTTGFLLVVGVALAAGGFLFFKTALYLFGLLLGAGLGLMAADTLALEMTMTLVAAGVGAVFGIGIASTIRTLLVVVPGVLTGVGVVILLTDVSLAEPASLLDPMVAGGAVAGVVAAWLLETAILILVSASWGATLVSIALGASLSASPGELDATLSNLLSTGYWVVFGGGILAQVAVWYYLRVHVDDDQDARDVLLRKAGRTFGSGRSGRSSQ
ncbi:hypothetical protein [Halostella salina]|uniref:hypothetical protein n=1 Tax=Halostella salina TaxID=1547897 RepID=UPI000EF76FA1|nr:hypothetical protein [Halostella salina]